MTISREFIRIIGVLIVVLGLAVGASTTGQANSDLVIAAGEGAHDSFVQLAAKDEEGANDPFEPMNRFFFEFNEVMYAMFLRPFSEFYAGLLPPTIRQAIGGFLENLASPVVLANDILQAEPQRAFETVKRTAINSTVGLGGIWDASDKLFGISGHDEDFGQTLGKWGVGEGFYLVLPFLGPSNPRDAIGEHFVDSFFDPLNLWASNTDREGIIWARGLIGAVHKFSGLMDELAQTKKTSIDYYATIRSIYRQKREADIRNGTDVDLPPIPDLTPDISFDVEEDPYSHNPEPGDAQISQN